MKTYFSQSMQNHILIFMTRKILRKKLKNFLCWSIPLLPLIFLNQRRYILDMLSRLINLFSIFYFLQQFCKPYNLIWKAQKPLFNSNFFYLESHVYSDTALGQYSNWSFWYSGREVRNILQSKIYQYRYDLLSGKVFLLINYEIWWIF